MQPHNDASFAEDQQAVHGATEDAGDDVTLTLTAFAAYLDEQFPVARSLTVAEGIDAVSAIVGVPQRQVVAALELDPLFTSANAERSRRRVVSTTTLCFWMQQLLYPTGCGTEAWWRAPGVHLYDFSTEQGDEGECEAEDTVGDGDDISRPVQRRADNVTNSSLAVRSGPPPRPASSSCQTAENSCREMSTRPTRNSGSWRCVSSGRSSTTPLSSAAAPTTTMTTGPPSQRVVPSMDEIVATALSELDVLAGKGEREDDDEGAETRGSHSRLPLHVDRLPSPFPVKPQAVDDAPADAVPPPSTTLAELEPFVHRGKTVKVCRQFMQCGSCSYGARCLFHHPAPATAAHADGRGVRGGVVVRWEERGVPCTWEEARWLAHQTATSARGPLRP